MQICQDLKNPHASEHSNYLMNRDMRVALWHNER